MIPQLTAPVQQSTPQDSALDEYLNEEMGSVMMEGYGPEDELPFSKQAQLDPNAMLAAINPGKAAKTAAEAAAELAARGGAKQVAAEAEAMPDLNPFAESIDDPEVMGDPQPAQDAVLESVQQTPDPAALVGRQAPSNINLDHFNDPAVKQLMDMVSKAEGGYAGIPQRKVQTHKETIEKAQSKKTLEKALNKKVSDKWEPEEMVFIYKTMEAKADSLNAIGKRITEIVDAGGEPDGELLNMFNSETQTFRALQATASGAASEAGRLLNALQAISKAGTSTEYYRNVAAAIEGGGGRDAIIQRARMFSNDPDLARANQIVELTWQEKTWKAAMQVRYNMMLSSVRTHGANIAGGTITGVIETLPKQAMASTWSYAEYLARNVIPGMKPLEPSERVNIFSEMPAELAGIRTGAIDGMILAKKMAMGQQIDAGGGSKFFDEIGLRYDPAGVTTGTLAKVGTTPTRLLEAEDAFFKSIYFNQKLNQLAIRRSRGMENQSEAYKQLIEFPPEDMVKEAREYSERLTLTNDPNVYSAILGGVAKSASQVTSSNKFLKILIPFVKTPANALGYALELNNLGGKGLFSETTMKALRGEQTPVERAEYMGTVMTAAGMWALLSQLYEEGTITGAGPEDATIRAAWEASGWQPNSILVGDKYYSLNRTDPLGMSLALFSTGAEAFSHESNKDAMGTGIATILSIAEIIKDKSMLVGLADFFELVNGGSEKVATSMIASNAASFIIPNIARDVREMSDPHRRELAFDNSEYLEGQYQRFKKYTYNAAPGLSKSVPPTTDVNGNYMFNGGNLYWRGLVPVRVTHIEKQDPVAAMYMLNGTPVTKPSYVFRIPGPSSVSINTLQLDDQQGWLYHEYQKTVGKERHDLVAKFIESPQWKQLAAEGGYGPGSQADEVLRVLISKGMKIGQVKFLEMISGTTTYQPMINGVAVGDEIDLVLPYSNDDLKLIIQHMKGKLDESETLEAEALLETGVYKVKPKSGGTVVPHQQKEVLEDATGEEIEF